MLNQVQCFRTIFRQQGLTHLAYQIITFIELQTLYQIISEEQSEDKVDSCTEVEEKVKQTSCGGNKMKQMVRSYYFIREYLNKTDRSMYYSFYQQPEFISIQKQFVQQIVSFEHKKQTPKTKYSYYFKAIQHIFKEIQREIQINQDQFTQLKRIFTDPCLPLPGLKRQNQGIYCNSSFQFFLVGLRFGHKKQQITAFSQMIQKLLSQEQNYLKYFLQIQKDKHTNPLQFQNLHLIRYTPYEINLQNYESLLIQGHQIHNFIVYIFVLTDIYVDSVVTFIDEIKDPFYKFSQCMSRYAIFRSFVMELEENLSSIFHNYDSLYCDTIRDSVSNKPRYCFWRPAMTKWFVKMSKIHYLTNQVYFMLLTKIRQQNLITLAEKYPALKKYEISLQNNLEMNSLAMELKTQLYQKTNGQNLLEEFIQNNSDTVEALVFQYVEYIIDLAVNERTVHWCGHSKHRLETPYNLFNDDFKKYNEKYFLNLKKCCSDIKQKDSKGKILHILIQQQINLLEEKNVKPLTLREIVEDINSSNTIFQGVISQQSVYNNSSVSKVKVQQEPISFDYQDKDDKLKYFNQKAKICESIEGEEKYFFSIPPLISAEQMLIKSIETKDSSQCQEADDNSSYEYVSDGQSEENEFKEDVESFKIYQNSRNQEGQNQKKKKVKQEAKNNKPFLEKQKNGLVNDNISLQSPISIKKTMSYTYDYIETSKSIELEKSKEIQKVVRVQNNI